MNDASRSFKTFWPITRPTFKKTILLDEGKTELTKDDGSDVWFTAGEIEDPELVLTIFLPGGITISFDTLPVKPEWCEQ